MQPSPSVPIPVLNFPASLNRLSQKRQQMTFESNINTIILFLYLDRQFLNINLTRIPFLDLSNNS